MCIYICIYIYICVICTYIYIYVYVARGVQAPPLVRARAEEAPHLARI